MLFLVKSWYRVSNVMSCQVKSHHFTPCRVIFKPWHVKLCQAIAKWRHTISRNVISFSSHGIAWHAMPAMHIIVSFADLDLSSLCSSTLDHGGPLAAIGPYPWDTLPHLHVSPFFLGLFLHPSPLLKTSFYFPGSRTEALLNGKLLWAALYKLRNTIQSSIEVKNRATLCHIISSQVMVCHATVKLYYIYAYRNDSLDPCRMDMDCHDSPCCS